MKGERKCTEWKKQLHLLTWKELNNKKQKQKVNNKQRKSMQSINHKMQDI